MYSDAEISHQVECLEAAIFFETLRGAAAALRSNGQHISVSAVARQARVAESKVLRYIKKYPRRMHAIGVVTESQTERESPVLGMTSTVAALASVRPKQVPKEVRACGSAYQAVVTTLKKRGETVSVKSVAAEANVQPWMIASFVQAHPELLTFSA